MIREIGFPKFLGFQRHEITSVITYGEVKIGFAMHLCKNSLMIIIYLLLTKENRCADIFSVCVCGHTIPKFLCCVNQKKTQWQCQVVNKRLY